MSEDGSSAIDDFLLELCGTDLPRVCFIPTASGDSESYVSRFEAAFDGRAATSVLSLFGGRRGYGDPMSVAEQDLIYVGGGSTANLLALWRLHGLHNSLRSAAAGGTILAGISAGMNCWFEESSTDSFGPLAPFSDGLGFLPGSACPHYRGEPGRRDKYLGWVAERALQEGYAVDDHVALVFRDGELVEAVSERPEGRAFHVSRDGDGALESELGVRQLVA